MFPKSFLLQGCGAMLAALAVSAAHAQQVNYPTKAVKLVIPFSTGGSNDIVGRYIGEELSKRLGQPFVVENRGGAGGTIGTEYVAKSAADGYTLLLVSQPHVANGSLYKRLPYDPVKDFAAVGRIATAPVVICVTPGLPVKTLPELISYAKAHPNELNYVSSGVGSAQHLAGAMLAISAGVDMIHIPYKGSGEALTDVAGGHAQVSVGTVLQALPYIKGNRMRPLAVSGDQRQSVLPNVPTAKEAGLSGFDADNWWGILAPAGTPPAVVKKLSDTMAQILALPETRKHLEEQSATVAYLPPDQFSKYVASETTKWTQIIKKLDIQAE